MLGEKRRAFYSQLRGERLALLGEKRRAFYSQLLGERLALLGEKRYASSMNMVPPIVAFTCAPVAPGPGDVMTGVT